MGKLWNVFQCLSVLHFDSTLQLLRSKIQVPDPITIHIVTNKEIIWVLILVFYTLL